MQKSKLILLAFAPVIVFVLFDFIFGFDSLLVSTEPDPKDAIDYGVDTEALYSECTGNPFEDFCSDKSCIEGSIENRVYGIWEARFKEIHGMDDAYFTEHIRLVDVAYSESKFNWVRIDYVYSNGWMRSRQSESINLSAGNNFKSMNLLTDVDITSAVNLSIESAEKYTAPIVSWKMLEREMKTLYKNLPISYDFCHIDFINVEGSLVLPGSVVIKEEGNKCAHASLNVNTGVLDVVDTACVMTL